MTNRERLLELAAGLPEDVAGEVLDFAEHARSRRVGPDAEDRAWLDADLARANKLEPYDWGPDGPPKGKPVAWDAGRQAFVIVGGRDEPA